MSRLPDLAPAELEIMNIIWGKGELSTRQVVSALPENRKLAYNTVATVLTRLRDKGYVDAVERNFAYVYRPLVPQSQVQERKLDDLVDRVLRGSLSPLAVYISKKRKLKPEQLAALEDILKSETDEEG